VKAVFLPEVVTRRLLVWFPEFWEFETLIVINIALIYFAIYFVFGLFWPRLEPYFKNPYFGAIALFAINVLVIYPIIGRGLLGYRLPQGWLGASLPLVVSHWIFARGVQYQRRRLTALLRFSDQ